MEYIYSAMLLHSAGKKITEAGITSILEAAGIEADSAKVKALMASLKDVNIDKAIEKAASAQAPVVAPAGQAKEEKPEAKEKEEEAKTEEEAAKGLSALFE